MDKISIFNYEIFYLDYLEGKLGEEDTAMLMAFLEEHPECRLEDEELPTLMVSDRKLDADLKKGLRQIDEDELVSKENLDHFLIAKAEGVLNDQKINEVSAFVERNDMHREEELIGMTYFEPDLDLTYKHKKGLKRGRSIVMWPYVAAAASILLFFFLFDFGDASEPSNKGFTADKDGQKTETGVKEELLPVDANHPVEYASTSGSSDNERVIVPVKYENDDRPLQSDRPVIDGQLPTRQLLSSVDQKRLEPVMPRLKPNVSQQEVNFDNDMAYMGFNDIANPIEPITKILSEKTKRDIDFRAGRSNVNRSKGFYLKIGKFELSRRKH